MKKNTLTALLTITINLLFAQNCNLVLFSEGGEQFYLIVNGIQHNQTPETNVKIQGLTEAPYKTKVVFEDSKIAPITKTMYTANNTETTYSIRFQGDSKAGKGIKKIGNSMIKTIGNTDTYGDKPLEYKIKMVSQTPLSSPTESTPVNNSVNNSNLNSNTSHTTTTTTTTNTNVNAQPNGISMNVSINDGMSNENSHMNVNVNDNTTYTESTTVTTTTNGNSQITNSNPVNSRCDYPMDNTDYLDGKKSIESKTFADSKMTIAKQITKNSCPTAVQIRDYTKLFTFESGKLEYAKFAYDYCYDKGNYYKVNDAFGFESSISELNEHTGN